MSRAVRVAVNDRGRPLDRDDDLVAALAAYQDAVVRARLLDPTTTELVRLRCARQHDCRICQTLRLSDAVLDGVDSDTTDQVDHYESSALSERHKTALRIVDAFIWRPTTIDAGLSEQAREHFSEAELAELLVDITKWSTQKIHVTLGTDGADRLPTDETGVCYFSFDDDGQVAVMTSTRPGT